MTIIDFFKKIIYQENQESFEDAKICYICTV